MAWASVPRLLAFGAFLLPALAAAVAPGDLLVLEAATPGFSASRLSSVDPDTGAFTLLPTGWESLRPLDVAAGRDGTIAGVFQSDQGGFVGLFYLGSSGAETPDPLFFSASLQIGVENHGDLLSGSPGQLGRYRVRYGFEGNQLLSAGDVSDVAVGPSGEIYVVEIGVGPSKLQSVDPVTGVRTLVASPSPFPIAVEPSGDVVGFAASGDLVRVDVPSGSVSVVASLGFQGRVSVDSDGTILVAVRESAPDAGDGFVARVDPVTGAATTQPLARGLGAVAGFAVVSCTEVDGACFVEAQCSDASACDDGNFCTGVDVCNADGLCERGPDACPLGGDCLEDSDSCFCTGGIPCGDGLFCNGVETCSNPSGGTCQPGAPLCPPEQFCVEPGTCLDCLEDAHCDDGLACNGAETCSGGTCQPGAPLCAPGEVCVEPGSCFECLVDPDCDDGVACNGAETCNAGACQPGAPLCAPNQFCVEPGTCVECVGNAHCDDGSFCNGAETCNVGACQPGTPPCAPDEFCVEPGSCLDCLDDADCDDGLFCTGVESCGSGGACDAGAAPCSANESCNEAGDQCEPQPSGDLDIQRFAAPSRARTGDTATLTLKLRNGAGPSLAIVHVTGVQNGVSVFDDTRTVVAAPDQRLTESYTVPITATGTIAWSATLLDGDPDPDVAADATSVTR